MAGIGFLSYESRVSSKVLTFVIWFGLYKKLPGSRISVPYRRLRKMILEALGC